MNKKLRKRRRGIVRLIKECFGKITPNPLPVKNLSPFTTHFSPARKRAAFTLAETLITLGIIGVVAAITIPTLIKKHEKTVILNQIKSTVSIVSQAAKMYMADEGVTDLKDTSLRSTPGELENFVKKYMKVVFDCEGRYHVAGKHECFARYYSDFHGYRDSFVTHGGGCEVVVVLANGVALCADLTGEADREYHELMFEADVNAHRGPNVFGKDFITFQMKSDGTVYDYYYEVKGSRPGPKGNIRGWNSNTGALGQILHDGWQILYY